MAQNKTKKSSSLIDYLIVAFVLVTTLLVVVEIGGNVGNEIETRQANAIEITQPTPAPLPTLSPEEYSELMKKTK